MIIAETKRLTIRHLTEQDAEFMLQLLNEERFIQNIGDKGVRTKQDALNHLLSGPIKSYHEFGFGLNKVELTETRVAIGVCGLIKREQLDAPDLGFALLSAYTSKGYGFEATQAILQSEPKTHQLKSILAIVNPENIISSHLLKKLGFNFLERKQVFENLPALSLFEYNDDYKF